VGVVVCAAAVFAGCQSGQKGAKKGAKAGQSGAGKKAGEQAVVVATYKGGKITVGDVEARLSSQPGHVRMRFSSPAGRKHFLKKLLRFEVLAKEAERRGLDKHPDVVRVYKQAMVSQLMRRLNKELISFKDISEAEIKARYEKNKARYTRKDKLGALLLVVATEKEAKALLAEARKHPQSARFFVKLSKEKSIDAQSKKKMGRVEPFNRESKHLEKALIDELYKVPVWGVAGPVAVKNGYALAMKTMHRAASTTPLSVVRDAIKNELYREKRYKAVMAYADKLRKAAKITVFQDQLAKVKPMRNVSKIHGLERMRRLSRRRFGGSMLRKRVMPASQPSVKPSKSPSSAKQP
jgi:peptidyl-prolyl cis-trans isomerase C